VNFPWRRTCALVFLILHLSVVGTPSPAIAAGPMPPQLPSAEEMARLEQQLSSTLTRVRSAQASLDGLVVELERQHDHLTQIAGEIIAAQGQLEGLDAELRAAQASMDKRARSVYKSDRVGMINALLSVKTFRQFVTAFGFIRAVGVEDSKSMLRVRELKAQALQVRLQLEGKKVEQQSLLAQLGKQRSRVETSLRALGKEYEGIKAEVDKRRQGFAFPVRAPYSYTDSWGAPRMEGTSYYHRHEGTDIFALSGTPVLAVVDGVIEKVGTASLGGIKLWLRSPGDNWTYYYAHLSGYAGGIGNGVRVKKGDVLGYVGNTGNARGTPPHLHFETHVPSGPPTNPYPILLRVDLTKRR
jgi:murein DD-endopeptidase MepM/ murein hydrolase activator NlpD